MKEPTVSVLLADEGGATLATVFQSGPLGNYSFDHFTGYSPAVKVQSKAGLGVANEQLVFVVLQVTNNGRNLQIPIDDLGVGFDAHVQWAKVA